MEKVEEAEGFLISKSSDEDQNQAYASGDLPNKKKNKKKKNKKKNYKKTQGNSSQVSMTKNDEAEESDEHSKPRDDDKTPVFALVSEASEDLPQKEKNAQENSSQGALVAPKPLFQRVFSEDDEIRILEAMLDFVEKTQSDPVTNIDEFTKNFKLDVTKSQLHTKMKRLKGAYKKNVLNQRDGNALNIRTPTKMEAFELSRKIWGMSVLDAYNSKAKGDVVAGGHGLKMWEKIRENDDCVDMDSASLEEWIMNHEMENVGRKKKRKMEAKLKDIQVAEMELFAMKYEYKAEKLRLICDAKKASL